MKSNSSIFVLVVSLFIIVFMILSIIILSDSYFTNTDTSMSLSKSNTNTKNYNCAVSYEDGDFTYDEAKKVCESKNGRLATIYDMADAYKNNAHWCNIGWVEGQLGLFPIQEEQWTDGECGEPGLNGQYYSDKNYKFGANCIYN